MPGRNVASFISGSDPFSHLQQKNLLSAFFPQKCFHNHTFPLPAQPLLLLQQGLRYPLWYPLWYTLWYTLWHALWHALWHRHLSFSGGTHSFAGYDHWWLAYCLNPWRRVDEMQCIQVNPPTQNVCKSICCSFPIKFSIKECVGSSISFELLVHMEKVGVEAKPRIPMHISICVSIVCLSICPSTCIALFTSSYPNEKPSTLYQTHCFFHI